MAFKNEPKMKSPFKNTSEFEQIDKSDISANDLFAMITTRRETAVAEVDGEVMKLVAKQYEEFTDYFAESSEDEQITKLARMHAMHESMEYIIGKCFKKVDARIMSGKMHQYSSITGYIKAHYPLTGISVSKAFRCMSLVDVVPEKVFLAVGIRKALILQSIKDERARDRAAAEAVKTPALTVTEFAETAKAIVKKLEDPKAEEEAAAKRQEKIDRQGYYDLASFSVYLNGQKQILVECKNKHVRDLVNAAIQEREADIKREVARKLLDEGYPLGK